MKIILCTSAILLTMSHPMTMLLSVMFLVFFLSMLLYLISQLAIVSMIMILLILGGMLIIFLYMVSLCPNNKIYFNKKKMNFSIILMILIMKMPYMLMSTETSILMKMYFNNFLNMLILMMMYLMFSLLVVMKNSKLDSNPMKMAYSTYVM
uniref:NADH dehydrogenase subunit 6 n=1 Tax=Bothriocroton concolor TaxID=65640 RepID=H9M733_BOTCN|nr:NADH dehydrogenase subunit 6 [Bothriocroton concolor]AET63050.1 NADH dehydrogenase subunit 6 [Bothriocroton concolor]